MEERTRTTYPMMPVKWWWDLRRQFQQTIPVKVSDTYLGTVLGLKPSSAQKVALPQFRLLGIVNQDGTANDERARAWRDDSQYKKVCSVIVKERYPQEIFDTFPTPSEDNREAIEQWFQRTAGVGKSAASAMAAFFLMISRAEVINETEVQQKTRTKEVRTKTTTRVRAENRENKVPVIPDIPQPHIASAPVLDMPSININIEIHISADATTTQIEKIFESMAKNLNIGRK
ncbi:MAG: DUF5343 domain-containing protein [Dehalococcoidales bacterium]|jgi:hypothetical protein